MTRYIGIIGYPVGHSISPAFQQAALDHYGLDVRYEAWETPLDVLQARVAGLRDADLLGASVTVPHKEEVLGMLDEVDEVAAMVGAVNVIVNRDGRLVGYNTDAIGFLQALGEMDFDPLDKRALVLGAGGAGRAVGMAMGQQGLAELYIANRTEARARRVADQIGPLVPIIEGLPLTTEAIAPVVGRCDLIVNCTSIGMRGGPGEGQSLLSPELIPAGALVNDLVYNPPLTPLLKAAQAAGARILSGLPMLVYQGAVAFELWTERDAPVDVMRAAAERSLGQQEVMQTSPQRMPQGEPGPRPAPPAPRQVTRYTESRRAKR